MIAAIGGRRLCARGMSDKLRALETRQDEVAARLSVALPDLPDIHPNIAAIYRRKVERLSEALNTCRTSASNSPPARSGTRRTEAPARPLPACRSRWNRGLDIAESDI